MNRVLCCGQQPGAEAAVDWRAKVELFEEIRREYEFGVGAIHSFWSRCESPRYDNVGVALCFKRQLTHWFFLLFIFV